MYRRIPQNACAALAIAAAIILLPLSGTKASILNESRHHAVHHAAPHTQGQLWTQLSPAAKRQMSRQGHLVKSANQLDKYIGTRYRSQYGGVAVDVPMNKVILYWKGSPLPESIKLHLLGMPAETSIRQVQYSKEELDAAKRSLIQNKSITKVQTKPDHSGLEVTAQTGTHPDVTRISSVPVTITGTATARSFDCTPWTPCSPYKGGTMIQVDLPSGGPNRCTSAYRVLQANGQDGMLTADHCGLDKSGAWSPTGSVRTAIGEQYASSIAKHNANVDAMVVSGGTYNGWFFDNAWDSEGDWAVTNYTSPVENSQACSMGAFSGGDCNWTITDPSCSVSYGPYQNVNGVCMDEANGEYAVGPGDSGGPVYYVNDGLWDSEALGIINAGEDPTHPCWEKSYPGRGDDCADNLFSVPVNQIFDQMNLGLLTDYP